MPSEREREMMARKRQPALSTSVPRDTTASIPLIILDEQPTQNCTLVHLTGELTHRTAEWLRRELAAHLDSIAAFIAPGHGHLAVDLSEVHEVTIPGLAALSESQQYARQRHVQFLVVCPAPAIRQILRRAGLSPPTVLDRYQQ